MESKKNQDDLNFFSFCELWDNYPFLIRLGLMLTIFIIFYICKIKNPMFLVLFICLVISDLLYQTVSLFTVDRQANVFIKKTGFPILIKDLAVNQDDEQAVLNSKEPAIPGIDFCYDIKKQSDTKYILAFQVDAENFKVLSTFDCNKIENGKNKKISSETLVAAFKGLKKDYVYSQDCLLINIVGLNNGKEVKDLDVVNISDLNKTIILTESVYYPYIK